MSQHQTRNSAAQKVLSEPGVDGEEGKRGYGHPPIEHRFKPGKSGNPRGRPKGRPNVKTELERIVSKKVTVRDGERGQQMTLAAANMLFLGVKGAKGDVRSSGLFLNNALRMRLLGQDDVTAIDDAMPGGRQDHIPVAPASKTGPSDGLFVHLDPDLLSRDEGVELSRLSEIIDLDGFTALNTSDFERIKYIVNKGRGESVTIQ
jgi:hypothetical protein